MIWLLFLSHKITAHLRKALSQLFPARPACLDHTTLSHGGQWRWWRCYQHRLFRACLTDKGTWFSQWAPDHSGEWAADRPRLTISCGGVAMALWLWGSSEMGRQTPSSIHGEFASRLLQYYYHARCPKRCIPCDLSTTIHSSHLWKSRWLITWLHCP